MNSRAVTSCIYLGFFSQIAQVVLLREMLTTFAGVEMVLGLALGMWLLAAGAGSLAGNKIRFLQSHPFAALTALYGGTAVLFPLTLLSIRLLPGILAFSPGEIVGPETSLVGAVALVPLCFLVGMLFVANVRAFTSGQTQSVGRVYLLEALGAALGGLAITFLLIPYVSHLSIALVLLACGWLIATALSMRRRTRWAICAAATLIMLAGATSPHFVQDFDRWTRTRHRAIGQLLAITDSPYGQLAVTRYKEQYSLQINGTLAVSYPDRQSAEEAVHFALLSHPAPRTALLIGGGVGGAVSEALKHHIRLDYVELDPQVVRLAQKYFPRSATASLDSCRLIYKDGRAYLSRTAATYDVIIVNLGEPSSALINRFFTSEFFQTAKAHLTPGGVFSFRIPSSESYLSPEREMFLSSLYKTLSAVFAEVAVLPGSSATFLGTNQQSVLIRTPDEFAARIRARGLQTEFVNAYLLPFRLSDAAYEFLGQHLNAARVRLNTDLQPVCFLYDAILWNLHFHGPQKWLLAHLADLPLTVARGAFGLLMITVVAASMLLRSPKSAPPLCALFVTGLTGVAMQVVLMIGFQVVLGNVYAKIGLLTACFMIGMSAGSYALSHRTKYAPHMLAWLFILPVGATLLLLAFMVSIVGAGIDATIAEIIFYLFSLAFGFCGGALFVQANRLYLEIRHVRGAASVGTGYAMDLAGSALGAVAVSSILIPVWGVPFTVLLVAVCNLAALLVTALSARSQ